MKILGISGSPRGGNSEILLDEALKGAREEGAETEKIRAHELNISPCLECGACLERGVCKIEDDMRPLYDKILSSHIIISSPVFFGGLPSHLKSLIDRCQALWARRKGEELPEGRGAFMLVGAREERYFRGAKETLRIFMGVLKKKIFGELAFPGFEEKGEIVKDEKALLRAFSLGRAIARGESIPFAREYDVKPIGFVRNDVREGMADWERVESILEIGEEYEEHLYGVEKFSHIIVVMWMDRARGKPPERVHPRGRKDLPEVGLFSSRSPLRPNPIGVTVTRLLERRGRILKVKGLDAYDGTPILDIKPYMPFDIKEASFPEWVRRLLIDL